MLFFMHLTGVGGVFRFDKVSYNYPTKSNVLLHRCEGLRLIQLALIKSFGVLVAISNIIQMGVRNKPPVTAEFGGTIIVRVHRIGYIAKATNP